MDFFFFSKEREIDPTQMFGKCSPNRTLDISVCLLKTKVFLVSVHFNRQFEIECTNLDLEREPKSARVPVRQDMSVVLLTSKRFTLLANCLLCRRSIFIKVAPFKPHICGFCCHSDICYTSGRPCVALFGHSSLVPLH